MVERKEIKGEIKTEKLNGKKYTVIDIDSKEKKKKRANISGGKANFKKTHTGGKKIRQGEREVPYEEKTAKTPKKNHTAKSEGLQKSKGNAPKKQAAQQNEKNVAGKKTAPKASSQKADTRKNKSGTANLSAPKKRGNVKIISLGGLNEIGKNMTLYETENDALIVDCGLAFPDQDMPGVDAVIPDFSYVEKIKNKIRGVLVTHGHEDHIGAIPYLVDVLSAPIYSTRLTLGLIEGKLREKGNFSSARLVPLAPGSKVKLGELQVELIKVNHSIPDAVALAIDTPAGVIIQTGDFKIDYTPIENQIIDLARFGELGSKGVLALLSDSTNAERPGSSMSERKVGESFIKLFEQSGSRRIIIATFSSNIHRIQQIVDAAERYQRKVVICGRSMVNVVTKAIELGYLSVPENIIIDISEMKRYPHNEIVVVTTGSQGEPMSALSRMSMGEHRQIEITGEDFIIISATPIPGNEKFVNRVVNELMKLGADVVYEAMYEVHVSGHAYQEELRLMLGLTRPKFFIPVHGEYKHLKKHADLAKSMGLDEKNIFISDIGRVIETNGEEMKFTTSVPAGKVLVDGLGVGDVGNIVLRDRKHLAEDGIIIAVMGMRRDDHQIVSGPEIISRGFVYVRESEELMEGIKDAVMVAVSECKNKGIKDWASIKGAVKDSVSDFVRMKTKRSPMVLPVIVEI